MAIPIFSVWTLGLLEPTDVQGQFSFSIDSHSVLSKERKEILKITKMLIMGEVSQQKKYPRSFSLLLCQTVPQLNVLRD